MVPNLVTDAPSLQMLEEGEIPRILFSPTHRRKGGRWNDKYSAEVASVLEGLEKTGAARVILAEGMAQHALHALRQTVHISIDEVITGAYHQVSLEGLCAGNVVINNADDFSLLVLRHLAGSGEEPPFLRASEKTFARTLRELVADPERIRELQQKSYDYFSNHLVPERLVKRYAYVYGKVLDV